MGREVRRVPPNWTHPKMKGRPDRLEPMLDMTYEQALAEWNADREKWEAGERPSYFTEDDQDTTFEEYNSPPEPDCYRPWKDEDATWFQLWETVSEGTPVSPPFATREELIAYLAQHGDFWDQDRRESGWGWASARAFVDAGWAPTMAIVGGQALQAKDIPLVLDADQHAS